MLMFTESKKYYAECNKYKFLLGQDLVFGVDKEKQKTSIYWMAEENNPLKHIEKLKEFYTALTDTNLTMTDSHNIVNVKDEVNKEYQEYSVNKFMRTEFTNENFTTLRMLTKYGNFCFERNENEVLSIVMSECPLGLTIQLITDTSAFNLKPEAIKSELEKILN